MTQKTQVQDPEVQTQSQHLSQTEQYSGLKPKNKRAERWLRTLHDETETGLPAVLLRERSYKLQKLIHSSLLLSKGGGERNAKTSVHQKEAGRTTPKLPKLDYPQSAREQDGKTEDRAEERRKPRTPLRTPLCTL